MHSYRSIRRDFQVHPALETMLIDYYAKLFSPFLTLVCLRFRIIPNIITVFMMISGVLGAVCFALPWMPLKVCGLLLIHIWYILDCSDGEVARITQRFSKFGKEIDFTAHVLNHPLFNVAFVLSLLQLHRYDARLLLLVGLLSISSEMISRNALALQTIFELKMGSKPPTADDVISLRKVIIALAGLFTLYPTLALVFPVFYLVDIRYGTSLSLGYVMAQTALTTLMLIRSSIRWVRQIVPL